MIPSYGRDLRGDRAICEDNRSIVEPAERSGRGHQRYAQASSAATALRRDQLRENMNFDRLRRRRARDTAASGARWR